jgi:hypothetical protein
VFVKIIVHTLRALKNERFVDADDFLFDLYETYPQGNLSMRRLQEYIICHSHLTSSSLIYVQFEQTPLVQVVSQDFKRVLSASCYITQEDNEMALAER